MIGNGVKFIAKLLNINNFRKINTMRKLNHVAWYRVPIMASREDHTIKNTTRKNLLTAANRCWTMPDKNEKTLEIKGLGFTFCRSMLAVARYQIIPTQWSPAACR